MLSSLSAVYLASLLSLSLSSGYAAPSSTVRSSHDLIYFFNFGDSYTQDGFADDSTNVLRNTSDPTGEKLGSNTFALGKNYVEWLTTVYNTTEVFDYDFAVSGSTIDQDVVSPGNLNGKSTFKDQVERLFLPTYSKQANGRVPWTGDNSIFSIFFGINDIVRGCSNSTQQDQLIVSYLKISDKLAAQGARKFLMINVPPVNRSPAKCFDCNATTCSSSIASFNSKLRTEATAWAKSKNYQLAVYDLYSLMTKVLDSPQCYGFDNATCADRKGDCVWQSENPFHTGFTFNKIQADDMTLQMIADLDW